MLQMGSMLYFGDTTVPHKKQFAAFIRDIVSCTFGDVRNASITFLNEFKKVMNEFQVNSFTTPSIRYCNIINTTIILIEL